MWHLASAGAAPSVLTLDNLVLNPAGSGGSCFLLLTVAMECGGAPAIDTLQTRDAELRGSAAVYRSPGREAVDRRLPGGTGWRSCE